MSTENIIFDNSSVLAFQEPAVSYRSRQGHEKILRALEDKDNRALKSLVKSKWSAQLEKLP